MFDIINKAEAMAGTENTPKHRKGDSFHRRRTYEINNAGGFEDIHDDSVGSAHLKPHQDQFSNHDRQEADSFAFDDATMDIFVGQQVKVRDVPGLAMVWWVQGDMIGVELESTYGNCDGVYNGERKFMTSANTAMFVARERVDRIFRNLSAPRFRPRSQFNVGDVAMISASVGVGVVRYASSELIGCQLNEATGNSNGEYQGHRYFSTNSNHAIFVNPTTCRKIEAEDLLNKLNDTVVRLQQLEQELSNFNS